MKNLLFLIFSVFAITSGYSQSDTLFTKERKKIPCKLIEIGELEIKYKLANAAEGPVYVVNRLDIIRYTLSTGFTEVLLPDELSIENEHAEIIKNRTVIKLHPFSFVNDQISVAYEKVLKVGTNIDLEAGYINNHISENALLTSNLATNSFYTGAYVKPGVKFFLGQDFSIKGLKYAHPLKGRYIRLDIALSYLNFQNVRRNTNSVLAPAGVLSTNINSFAYGGFVNYGRQFILGNILTLEGYLGLGFTGRSVSYTNKDFTTYVRGYGSEERSISNYHGFLRTPGIGFSFTGGFRIGYIIPEKKTIKKPTNDQPSKANKRSTSNKKTKKPVTR